MHSLAQFAEGELKKIQNMSKGIWVKTINIFYDMGSEIIFCLVDAPNRMAVEKHHEKFGLK
jgi:hypothetical protein